MTLRAPLLLAGLLALAAPALAATDPLEDGVTPAQAAPQPPSSLGPAPLPAPQPGPQSPMVAPPREAPASSAPQRPAPPPSRCSPPSPPTS